MWALSQHLYGQWRMGGKGAVMGFDMIVAMQMADAMGVCRQAVAEMLPGIGIAMAVELNKGDNDG